jgi:spermidine/putrescine-binding protein
VQARNRAREAGNEVAIAFRVPKEGAMMSVDMPGVPADVPHPENAVRFIDYLLRPSVIADITNAVSYKNPNLPATALVKPEIRDDPAVYPPLAFWLMARAERRRRAESLPMRLLGYRLIWLTFPANAASRSNTGSNVIRTM